MKLSEIIVILKIDKDICWYKFWAIVYWLGLILKCFLKLLNLYFIIYFHVSCFFGTPCRNSIHFLKFSLISYFNRTNYAFKSLKCDGVLGGKWGLGLGEGGGRGRAALVRTKILYVYTLRTVSCITVILFAYLGNWYFSQRYFIFFEISWNKYVSYFKVLSLFSPELRSAILGVDSP